MADIAVTTGQNEEEVKDQLISEIVELAKSIKVNKSRLKTAKEEMFSAMYSLENIEKNKEMELIDMEIEEALSSE